MTLGFGMESHAGSLTCPECSQPFTQKSSLNRHAKRCVRGRRRPSRQKACRQCSRTKARCDLQKPCCGRCRGRGLPCGFAPQDDDAAPPPDGRPGRAPGRTSSSSPLGPAGTPPTTTIDLTIPEQRRRELRGGAVGAPNANPVVLRTVHLIVRILASWPRLMALHGPAQPPPMMHRLQFPGGRAPAPLANCYALAKMWAEHAESSAALVRETVLGEVRRLLDEYRTYDEGDLLAAAQSLCILLIVLFFCLRTAAPDDGAANAAEARLLLDVWGVTRQLARTGLFLADEAAAAAPEEDEEDQHAVAVPPPPSWADWATVSARRRTVLALHHVEWAWSLLRGYPVLTCFELGPLPAPAPAHLWRAADGDPAWHRDYADWRRAWRRAGGPFTMAEFFHLGPAGPLGRRAETWLAEADEFGLMLMAELNAIGELR